ncbi:MAG: PilZ domain-containing protein [Syntrophaceae bacterium]|nr:PilZ domain-containing protein [Syntrophaceae bacterium]
MDGSKIDREKRKRPRYPMDLPLEYRVIDAPDAYGGIVVDGSEIGLRIHSVKNLPVGTKLNIAVLFPKEFQMSNFQVTAEIIWKDVFMKEDWNGYQYGLKFVLIGEEDLQKLKQLLDGQR